MNSRFNYKPVAPRDSSNDDVLRDYEYKKRMKVLSTAKDGSVENYSEEGYFEEKDSSWQEFIESYNLGSVSQQVIDHLTKGTPLVTAHTLPSGDYTTLEKGAQIKHEMDEKGITLDMIIDALAKKVSEEQAQASPEGE